MAINRDDGPPRKSEESGETLISRTSVESKSYADLYLVSSREHRAWSQTIQPITRSIQDSYPNVFSTLPIESHQTVQQRQSNSHGGGQNIIEDSDLPPADGGRRAWSFMVGACMIEGLMWGRYYLLLYLCMLWLIVIFRFPFDIWGLWKLLRH
jgi:hypothetical protein